MNIMYVQAVIKVAEKAMEQAAEGEGEEEEESEEKESWEKVMDKTKAITEQILGDKKSN